jgi:hypothetical protein
MSSRKKTDGAHALDSSVFDFFIGAFHHGNDPLGSTPIWWDDDEEDDGQPSGDDYGHFHFMKRNSISGMKKKKNT